MSKEPLSYVCLDFETTGFNPQTDSLVEVCAMRVIDGEITSVFNTLIHYEGEWTEGLQKGHHTPEDLAKGMDEDVVTHILAHMLSDGSAEGMMIIAYNALFDMSFLQAMFDRNGWGTELSNPFIDPLTIARDRHSYPHKLGDMCKKYKVGLEEAHMAYDDTLALVALTNKMHEEKDIREYINVAGYKAQYGPPEWAPRHANLRAQGNIVINENTKRQAITQGKPYAKVMPKKSTPAHA